MNKHWSII